MKKMLPLALVAALAAAPAWAAGMGQQSGSAEQSSQPGMQDQQQSQQSPSLQSPQQSSSQQQPQQGQQEMIRQVQQNLQQQGYDVGNVDGIWGPNTQQALRQFQQEQGLQASGRLNQNTLAELNVEANPNQLAEIPDEALDSDLGAQVGGSNPQATDSLDSPSTQQQNQQSSPGITD